MLAIKRKRAGIFMPETVVFKSQVGGVGEGKGEWIPNRKLPLCHADVKKTNCIYLN